MKLLRLLLPRKTRSQHLFQRWTRWIINDSAWCPSRLSAGSAAERRSNLRSKSIKTYKNRGGIRSPLTNSDRTYQYYRDLLFSRVIFKQNGELLDPR